MQFNSTIIMADSIDRFNKSGNPIVKGAINGKPFEAHKIQMDIEIWKVKEDGMFGVPLKRSLFKRRERVIIAKFCEAVLNYEIKLVPSVEVQKQIRGREIGLQINQILNGLTDEAIRTHVKGVIVAMLSS